MSRSELDPDLDRLGDALRAGASIDLAREDQHARGAASEPRRARRFRSPRVLAGSTLGLAGAAAAIALALGAAANPSPAFAVTRANDGSVLVKLNYQTNQNLPQVNAKLAAMGTGEQISIANTTGTAPQTGPVTCTQAPGTTGPQVKVLEGDDGTQTISAGQSAGNTAEGTFHLVDCTAFKTGTTPSGNSGAGGSKVSSPGPVATPRAGNSGSGNTGS